jgi:hypothetical protein
MSVTGSAMRGEGVQGTRYRVQGEDGIGKWVPLRGDAAHEAVKLLSRLHLSTVTFLGSRLT